MYRKQEAKVRGLVAEGKVDELVDYISKALHAERTEGFKIGTERMNELRVILTK